MKVLTIKQPWASLICLGIKDVENRTWRQDCLVGEKILIMSSKKEENTSKTTLTWRTEYQRLVSNGEVPPLEKLPRGVILGYVDIVAIQEESDSIWAADASHVKYVLNNPHMFTTPLPGVHGQPRPINYDISLDELLAIPTTPVT
jgi:hypothetical protein